jgi:hypothetical protein
MSLPNLKLLREKLEAGFDESLFEQERTLPDEFKKLIVTINSNQITYYNTTAVVDCSSGLKIYMANNWFYIAAYFCELYTTMVEYKNKVFEILRFPTNKLAEEPLKKAANNRNYAESLFEQANYNGDDKEYLIKFLSDYNWWGGGKGLERNDFYYSPLLNSAKLVNQSQAYCAEITKFLAEHQDAKNILLKAVSTFGTPDDRYLLTANREDEGTQYIVNDGLKEQYTIDELADILKDMKEDLGTAGVHLFGLRYGGKLENISVKDMVTKAGIHETYYQEVMKQKKVHELLWGNDYGIRFLKSQDYVMAQTKKKAESKTKSLSLIRAMRTKPFLLLAGISGTGKSRVVKELAYDSCPDVPAMREDMTSPGNYCLIEVKPNWHDSTELLGYESRIGGAHYIVTPFVKFLVKAMKHKSVPFFVCLDEMNLAPVEQYFAEFLSVLESRKLVNGEIVTEPLIPASVFAKYNLSEELFGIRNTETAKDYNQTTTEDAPVYGVDGEIYEKLRKEGLRIPSNVVVVGTVNMDETTHQFSRKVIDRAMTIEMNIGDGVEPFEKFFNSYEPLEYTENWLPKEVFIPTVASANDVLTLLPESDREYLKNSVPNILGGLNKALDNTPFKVAYRVQNELVIYFYTLRQDMPDESAEDILATAMDEILMMKVLPRIEGDDELLEVPLKSLLDFTSGYPKSNKKVEEMAKRLPSAHFTSFWP